MRLIWAAHMWTMTRLESLSDDTARGMRSGLWKLGCDHESFTRHSEQLTCLSVVCMRLYLLGIVDVSGSLGP